MVAIGKRYTELTALGRVPPWHRPVMRWYRPWQAAGGQRVVTAVMLVAYVLWALTEHDAWMRGWHLASAVPLAAALIRFDLLTGKGRPAGGGPDRQGPGYALLRAGLADPVRGGPY